PFLALWPCPPQNIDLLAQQQVLSFKRRSGAEQADQRPPDQFAKTPHRAQHQPIRAASPLDEVCGRDTRSNFSRPRFEPPGSRPIVGVRAPPRRPTARVSFFAASGCGLAFERAHFSPNPLNSGSPDADGRSRLVDARAAPQKPLDCPFLLSIDPWP